MKIFLLSKGVSSHTKKWAVYFSHKGVKVFVLSFVPTKIDGVEVIDLKPIKIPFKLGYILTLGKIHRLLKIIKPDILHSHFTSSYGLLGAVINFHPFVVSAWGSDVLDFPKKSFLHKKIIKFVLQRADKITTTSLFMKQELGKYTQKEIVVIPFGVDTTLFSPGRKEDRFTIVCTKALEKIYGIEYLIKAFLLVQREINGVKLVLIGEGKEKLNLEHLVKKFGLNDKVSFTGQLEQSQVAEAIKKSHLLVIPSLKESFGVSALEGSACQIPIVASDIPGLRETLVPNKTGLLFKTGSSEDLAKQILKIAKNKKLASVMGKQGREFVLTHYQWEDNAGKMLELYNKLLFKI